MYEMLLYGYGGTMTMKTLTFTLDGQSVQAQQGDTILQAARRANVYIPTMCYLNKTNPIASCRLCVVSVRDSDEMILACQTPVIDGIEIVTTSQTLHNERQNIMELYAVNHPLECGVCDKSGACDLQNAVLDFQIDTQHFTAQEQKRNIQQWGLIQYDPNLCILCEKCVHVCNEVIGDDAICIQTGGYKSTIVPKGSSTLDCTFCGECIAVCPVGALISKDFKYSANAWEMSKIPSTCAHCSAGCHLYYEVKHQKSQKPTIARVTNDFEFSTLCGAGRFAFNFANQTLKNDEAFQKAVQALNQCETIEFSSLITNEEAYLLNLFKTKLGKKLVNREASSYQRFLQAMSQTSG